MSEAVVIDITGRLAERRRASEVREERPTVIPVDLCPRVEARREAGRIAEVISQVAAACQLMTDAANDCAKKLDASKGKRADCEEHHYSMLEFLEALKAISENVEQVDGFLVALGGLEVDQAQEA